MSRFCKVLDPSDLGTVEVVHTRTGRYLPNSEHEEKCKKYCFTNRSRVRTPDCSIFEFDVLWYYLVRLCVS